MVNRKKRLRKGIFSLQEQIKIHEQKKIEAEEEGDEELARYYNKEISTLNKNKEKKENQLEKQ